MFGRRGTSSESIAPNDVALANDGDELIVPLWQPTQSVVRKSVESLLLERGHITEAHLVQARQLANQTPGKSLAQLLLQMNAASEAQILSAVAETLGLGFEQPDKSQIDTVAFELLPADYIRKHLVLPFRFDGTSLVVGMADPTNVFLIDELKRRT
jgi:type IV pilus assembly protein PilB